MRSMPTPAAPGLSAVAMPDLFTVHRSPARGAQPHRPGSLATAFGPADPIRPSTAGGPFTAGNPSTAAAPMAAAASSSAVAHAATSRGASSAPQRPAGPARATVLPRSYLPAPPPVSVRRTPATVAPPVPAVARGTSSTNRAAVVASADAVLRRSTFVESTAGLFRAADSTAPTIRRLDEGQAVSPMPDQLPSLMRVADSGYDVWPGSGQDDHDDDLSVPNSGRQLDDLVDKVVERIEQRVVDELERRGRRQTPGAF
jgi:hypothetical protein